MNLRKFTYFFRGYSSERSLKFLSGIATLPDPTKRTKRGEDSLFVSENAIGVADGVGSWSEEGIDAGEYSRELMQHASEIAKTCSKASQSSITSSPQMILCSAFSKTQAIGSTTACILQLHGTKLMTANLGDSGFRICRKVNSTEKLQENKWLILSKSIDQLHEFNCPLQLGHDSTDKPSDASISSFEVKAGDIIIAATDGLFDNLYDKEIVRLISLHYDENSINCMQSLAEQIASTAQQVAYCKKTETPFSVAARKAGYCWLGGKLDDITVITSLLI